MSRIKSFLIQLFRETDLFLPFFSTLLVNALIWFLIIARLPAKTDWIPLHFNTYFGIDWIGPWINVIYYPVTAILIGGVNLLLAAMLYHQNSRLSQWLLWSALIVQIIILTSLSVLIIYYFS